MKKILSVIALGLALTGCKQHIQIINGELPEGLVGYAGKLMGQYQGTMQGQSVVLTLALDGKKVILTTDKDILASDCASAVGNLREVYVKKQKNGQALVTNAIFEFDAGKCASQVWGRELSLSFKDKTPMRINAEIYGGATSRWECFPGAGYPGYPGYPSYPGHPGYYPPGYYPPGYYPPGSTQCRTVTDNWSLYGSFRKVQ